MKTTYFFLLSILAIACNNSSDSPKTTNDKTSEEVKKDEPSTAAPGNSGACSKLIFFQQGAEVEGASYNAAGTVMSKQLTKVLEVKNEDGMTVAYVESTNKIENGEAKSPMHYSYKCDGNKIYFDISSMLNTEVKGGSTKIEGGTVDYPINVSEGEKLPDASGVMKTERNGKAMEMKYLFTDRKVEAKEKITTTAGSWDCYKISYITEVEMDMPGMDEKSKEMMKKMKGAMKNKTSIWLAPDFGIVKMEMYMNDKLASRTEITSVKR